MLVYHFKERITISEKRIDTINDVLISVVKELKNIQLATTMSSQLPTVPTVRFPSTVVSHKINQEAWPPVEQPVEQIYYDISEVNQNVGPNAGVVASVPTKIVVSDEDDDDNEEDSEYSEESGSENEHSSDDGSEPEEEDVSDLGEEEESVSTVDGEYKDEDEDEDEPENIVHPIQIMSELSDDIPIQIEILEDIVSSPIELSNNGLSENPEDLEVDVDVDINVVTDMNAVGELEAHVSAPTTDISAPDLSTSYSLPIVSVELSEITEIIVPEVDVDPDAGSSISITDFEPIPEPASEPILPVSEPREEKPVVVGSRDAKEQKKEVYRKMSIHQLRTIAISSGLSADNKMKKADLIRLLETLDDEEDQ